MPIHVTCTGCQAKLKAPDTAAGKKTKCPKCQTIVSVPAAAGETGTVAKTSAAAGALPTKTKPDHWFLQTPDGSQYGPVPRGELDQWFSEGRVSADCQLLKEGSAQWQWAADLYPALAQLAATAASSSSTSLGSVGGVSNPLTPLSPSPTFSSSPGLTPLGAPALSPLGSSPMSSAATLPSFTTGTAPSSFGSPTSSPLNPYSAPAMGSYGSYAARPGLHPMVIVAGIFHILMGAWNVLNCLAAIFLAVLLLAGGGMAATMGANAEHAEARSGAQMLATLGAVGGVFLFVIALIYLTYGIVQISTAVGLFQRRHWARAASFVFAGLGMLLIAFVLIGVVIAPSVLGVITLMAELAYVVILFVAMCLPDATRDFR